MSKSVFISYSRKDAIDVAEFRSIHTFRDFEILIDDEEIEFNKPWKQNIRNKINDSNGAILFLTKNALNPESPIRTLELPLIAKRYADKEDNFNFFPIFLENIDEELLNNYSFTPLETKEEVSFVEFFQLYGEQQRTTVRKLTNRKRKHFYKTANANISHILEGGTLSPGETMLSKLSRRQRIRNMSIGFAVVISIFLFARTDTFARVLINAAERVQPENIDEGNSVLFNAIAGQLNNIDNLEELGADQALVENIEEVNQVNSESNEQGLSSSISADTSTTTISTSTTTTTTVAPATTTSSTPTTTTTTIKTYSLKFSDNVVEFPEIPYCKMTYEEVEEQLKAHFLANDIRLTIRKFLVETENTDCYGLASGSNKPYLVEIKDGDFIEVTVEWSSSKREFPTTIANSPNAIGNNERWDVYCDNSGKSYLDDAWRGEKTGSGSDQYFYFGLYTDLTSPDISCVPDAMLESLGYFLNSGYYCKNQGCVTSSSTTVPPTTTTTTVPPRTYIDFVINNPDLRWLGDSSLCFATGYGGGYWYIFDTDLPSWYQRSIKVYVNGSLFREVSFAEGDGSSASPSANQSLFRISASSGTLISISTETYGWNGQLLQSVTMGGQFPITIGNTNHSRYWQNLYSYPPESESELDCG